MRNDPAWWLAPSFASMAAASLWEARVARPMTARGGPGIVELELAGVPSIVRRFRARWGPDGLRAARSSLRWDYLLIVTYTVFSGLAVIVAGGAARDAGWRVSTAWLALVPLAAGAADALENLNLWPLVADGDEPADDDPRPARARRFASAKFALLGATIAYLLYGLLAWWVR